MIPYNEKFVFYSYRSFKNDNLKYNGLIHRDELREIDYIDFSKLSLDEIYKYLDETFDSYREDIFSDESHYKFYFFKEFVLREEIEIDQSYYDNVANYQMHIADLFNEPRTLEKYWRFYISDWNEEDKDKGIDSRTVTISYYTYDTATNQYTENISYMVKLDHVYQLILDLDKLLTHLEIIKYDLTNLNLFVLPVYMHQNTYNNEGKVRVSTRYKRISDYLYGRNDNLIIQDLMMINAGLRRFATLNFSMLKITESKQRPSTSGTSTRKYNRSTGIKRDYVVEHTNKSREVKLYLGNNMSVNIDKSSKNIFSKRYDDEVVTLYDYKTQVRGHWSHYWTGAKNDPDRKRIAVWLEPYFRNAHNKARLIKRIEEDNNAV